jgi:hypothetical protein
MWRLRTTIRRQRIVQVRDRIGVMGWFQQQHSRYPLRWVRYSDSQGIPTSIYHRLIWWTLLTHSTSPSWDKPWMGERDLVMRRKWMSSSSLSSKLIEIATLMMILSTSSPPSPNINSISSYCLVRACPSIMRVWWCWVHSEIHLQGKFTPNSFNNLITWTMFLRRWKATETKSLHHPSQINSNPKTPTK